MVGGQAFDMLSEDKHIPLEELKVLHSGKTLSLIHIYIPLNENGLNQAKACGNALKDVTFDRILSSDLSRALVTAETIRGDRTTSITVDKRLRELNFGDWEAMLFSDIEARWPGLIDEMYLRPHLVKVPNGESFKDLQDRAWAGLEEFLNVNDEEETLLIACHGGTIRTLLCKLLDISISHCWNFSQGNTCLLYTSRCV